VDKSVDVFGVTSLPWSKMGVGSRSMADLRDEIAAFDKMQAELESKHWNEWVIFQHGQLQGCYSTFETAAEDALERLAAEPYLIRQVGAGPVQFSGGMMMRPVHVHSPSGV
jgi:hypothetical protein